MKLPYGFYIAADGNIAVDQEKANVVQRIYRQYLSGMSLGGIADFLYKNGIPSPRGKVRWTQPVISNLLSNKKYIGPIITFDEFFIAQGEKAKRSIHDEDTGQRKATRYSSQSVLSGLLICAECGHNYRRITRPSGEVVWRCGNRVEHGKRFCQHSPSISEQIILNQLCDELNLQGFDEDVVRDRVETITIHQNGSLEIVMAEQSISQVLGW